MYVQYRLCCFEIQSGFRLIGWLINVVVCNSKVMEKLKAHQTAWASTTSICQSHEEIQLLQLRDTCRSPWMKCSKVFFFCICPWNREIKLQVIRLIVISRARQMQITVSCLLYIYFFIVLDRCFIFILKSLQITHVQVGVLYRYFLT